MSIALRTVYNIQIEAARKFSKPSSKKGHVESTCILRSGSPDLLETMRAMMNGKPEQLPFMETDKLFLIVTHPPRHKLGTLASPYVFVREDGYLRCYPEVCVPYDPLPVQCEARELLVLTKVVRDRPFLTALCAQQTRLTKKMAERLENIKKKIKK